MSEQVKLLFDECIGAHVAEKFGVFLRDVYPESHEIKHFFEYQKAGTPDEEWLPQIAELGFMVITGDRGKDSKKKKLPLLCLALKITHFMLAPSVHQMRSPDKIQAIVSLWPKIVLATTAEKGSRFLIYTSTSPHAMMRQIEISSEERAAAQMHLPPNGGATPGTLFGS